MITVYAFSTPNSVRVPILLEELLPADVGGRGQRSRGQSRA
jgi:hypothetical protein